MKRKIRDHFDRSLTGAYWEEERRITKKNRREKETTEQII
jgi:hypothetical protein